MKIEDRFLKNVLFIGVMKDNEFIPKATGFLAAVPSKKDEAFVYVVTAEHVISGLQQKGISNPHIRINKEDGTSAIYPTAYEHWHFHPDPKVQTDVAVAAVGIPLDDGMDPLFVDIAAFVTPEKFKEYEIGVGDEVVAIGLFSNHYGKTKNIPIVRVGNISALPDEPVFTKYCGYMDAYLIEARSIAGLSGSPVWYNQPPVRLSKDGFRIVRGGGNYLIGLIHGHFDVKNLNHDAVQEDEGNSTSAINTGIGIVVPAYRILETIMQPELEKRRSHVKNRMSEIESETTITPNNEIQEK